MNNDNQRDRWIVEAFDGDTERLHELSQQYGDDFIQHELRIQEDVQELLAGVHLPDCGSIADELEQLDTGGEVATAQSVSTRKSKVAGWISSGVAVAAAIVLFMWVQHLDSVAKLEQARQDYRYTMQRIAQITSKGTQEVQRHIGRSLEKPNEKLSTIFSIESMLFPDTRRNIQ